MGQKKVDPAILSALFTFSGQPQLNGDVIANEVNNYVQKWQHQLGREPGSLLPEADVPRVLRSIKEATEKNSYSTLSLRRDSFSAEELAALLQKFT